MVSTIFNIGALLLLRPRRSTSLPGLWVGHVHLHGRGGPDLACVHHTRHLLSPRRGHFIGRGGNVSPRRGHFIGHGGNGGKACRPALLAQSLLLRGVIIHCICSISQHFFVYLFETIELYIHVEALCMSNSSNCRTSIMDLRKLRLYIYVEALFMSNSSGNCSKK